MSYKITEEGNISTVFLNGEIDMDVTEKAKEVILPIVESGKEVHLNLKYDYYMDTSGISVLIESHQKALENNTKVVVKEVSKSVLKVIMLAKLEQIHTASLKEVRVFSREVFDKLKLDNDLKEELVLAIAEAAQNIVKHAYKGVENTTDHMQIKISLKDKNLEIGFFDKGKPVVAENIQHRKLDDIKPGGLGTFFIKQIMDDAVFKKDQQQWVNHLILSKKI